MYSVFALTRHSDAGDERPTTVSKFGPASMMMLCWLLPLLLMTATATTTAALQQQHRAWVVPKGVKFGSLERFKLQTVAAATATTPSNTSIAVATRAVGLNFADIFTILGYYKAANQVRGKSSDTFCPGLEFSGVVLDSDHCGDFQKGDRVFGFTRFGAYAKVVQVENGGCLRKLPDNWSHEQGAAFLVNALTAWHGLVTVAGMGVYQNKKVVVLIHSAAGGVGFFASEIAARRGGIVVGVVGNEDKQKIWLERIRRLCPSAQCIVRSPNGKRFERDLQHAVVQARCSATDTIDDDIYYTCSQDLIDQELGVDYVMESYGGKYYDPSLNIINAGGSLATYGSTSYNGSGRGASIPFLPLLWQFLTRPRIDPGALTSRNIRVGGFNLIFLTQNVDQLSAALEGCIACLSDQDDYTVDALSKVTPHIVDNVFDFDNGAVEALSALRSGKTVGKVVLSNPNNPVLKQ